MQAGVTGPDGRDQLRWEGPESSVPETSLCAGCSGASGHFRVAGGPGSTHRFTGGIS